jgi:ABC-type phosphate transport system substrate-binding protein
MNGLRALRICAFAVALPLLFNLSQQVSAAGGHEPVQGILWAVGAITVLFFLRALATEYSQGPEADLHKDLQWGLAAGGVLTILSNLYLG